MPVAETTKPAILFVALQTGAGANGGIASMGEIIQSLDRYRPIILTNIANQTTRDWSDAGIEVHIEPERAHLGIRRAPVSVAAAYAHYFLAIRRILKRSGAGIVHANDPLAFQLAAAAVKMHAKTRLIFSIRDTLEPQRVVPYRRFSWIFRTADHSFFLSDDMRERWTSIIPNARERSSATYSIVDFDRFDTVALSTELPKIVLVSGVLSPKKGQLRFLTEVAPILASAGIETWLSGDALGESPYANDCRKAAEPLSDKVRFLGYRTDMPELISRAHVVGISSQYEGLMRTMIEAISMGRPVVSTDVSSAREILEEPSRQAGHVVPLKFGKEMAEAILDLCTDEDRNREWGKNGAAIAREKFDRRKVMEAYQSVYDRLSTPV